MAHALDALFHQRTGRPLGSGRFLQIEIQLDASHSWHCLNGGLSVGMDGFWQFGIACLQADFDSHDAVIDGHALDESERNDVAAEAGVFHGTQRVEDLVLGDHGGDKRERRKWHLGRRRPRSELN